MANTMGTWESALEEVTAALRSVKISTALSHLKKAATELSEELEDERRLDGEAVNAKVVHYTSLETAHALLEEPSTQYLRLYDSVHLTDPQEGWYLFSGRDFSSIEQSISKWLESPVSHAYILSFLPWSDDPEQKPHDHLSHWRAYGDNGCGCSFVLTVPRDKLYEVNYDNATRDTTAAKLRSFLGTAAQVWDEVIRTKSASRHPRYEE